MVKLRGLEEESPDLGTLSTSIKCPLILNGEDDVKEGEAILFLGRIDLGISWHSSLLNFSIPNQVRAVQFTGTTGRVSFL
jgi:hypothetical protein